MQHSTIIRFGLNVLTASVLMTAGICGVRAQGPGGPGQGPGQGPGGPGNFKMPGDMQSKFAAMQKWQGEHKNAGVLSRTLMGIERINQAPDTKLNKSQAAKMLVIFDTWKSKSEMTEDQAKSVQKQVTDLLDPKQQKALAAPGQVGMMGRPGMMGGPRPGGPGMGGPGMNRPGGPGMPGQSGAGGPGAARPGGPGGPGMGGPGMGMAFPDPPKGNYNPLNADTFPYAMARPMVKKSMSDFVTTLQKQAK